MKIIQIAACSDAEGNTLLAGLDIDGNLYEYRFGPVEPQKQTRPEFAGSPISSPTGRNIDVFRIGYTAGWLPMAGGLSMTRFHPDDPAGKQDTD